MVWAVVAEDEIIADGGGGPGFSICLEGQAVYFCFTRQQADSLCRLLNMQSPFFIGV